MDAKRFIKQDWYSAKYESGFSIIFQVVEIKDNSMTFCRKDGIIIDNLPSGYNEIVSYGSDEPEYE